MIVSSLCSEIMRGFPYLDMVPYIEGKRNAFFESSAVVGMSYGVTAKAERSGAETNVLLRSLPMPPESSSLVQCLFIFVSLVKLGFHLCESCNAHPF